MCMSEAEFLNRLNKAFPEKVIFAEQSRLSEYLSLFVEIRRYARGAGVSSVQWLTDRGFIWKETGYIEPDMHSGDKCGLSPDPTAFELADYVFRTYPLAGEYQLTNKEDALLYQCASETIKKVLKKSGHTSAREDTVLVLETINLLKIWSSGLADEETSGSLWNYIFLQYGFNPEILRPQPIDYTIISEVQSKVHWHTTNVFSRLKGLSNITPLCCSTLWHQSKA